MRILHNSNQLYLQSATFLIPLTVMAFRISAENSPNARRIFIVGGCAPDWRRFISTSFEIVEPDFSPTARFIVSSVPPFRWRKNVRGHTVSCTEFFFANRATTARKTRCRIIALFLSASERRY